MKLFLTAMNGGLFPTTREAADRLAKQEGKELLCEIRRPRNLAHHRKFWSMCAFLAEHSSYTAEQVCDIFKLRTGLTTQSQLQDGTIVQHPGSISFAKLDQEGFEVFYERCLDVVAKEILPGVKRGDVERELMEYLR